MYIFTERIGRIDELPCSKFARKNTFKKRNLIQKTAFVYNAWFVILQL